MTEHIQTPAQTIGPFFPMALPYNGGPDLVPPHSPGAVRLHGTVFDGAGEPVPDSMLEIWQADAGGAIPQAPGSLHRDGYTFTGFGRAQTDRAGRYTFTTVKPGRLPHTAPCLAMAIFARGLLHHLFTRVYFPEDGVLQQADPVFTAVPEDRRKTLIAAPDAPGSYRFDIRLQGESETVFLDFRR